MVRSTVGSAWLVVGIVGLLLALADVGRSVRIDVSRAVAENSTTDVATTAAAPTTTSTTTTAKPPANLNESTKAPASPPPSLSNVTVENAETHEVQQRLGRRPRPVDDKYFCACDLTINLCDINCCCDIDCEDRALATFVCTETAADYDHSLGSLHSCSILNDALCVVVKPEATTSWEAAYDSSRCSQTRPRWPSAFPDVSSTDPVDAPRHAYRFGDTVHFYPGPAAATVDIGSLQPLSVAASLDGAAWCSVQLPLRFMADASGGCRRRSLAQANYVSRLRAQLIGAMVPTTRQSLYDTSGSGKAVAEFCSGGQVDATTNATRPNCVPLQLFGCTGGGGEIDELACRLQRNETDEDDGQTLDGDEWSNHLIRFDIVHDFDRILNASVYIVYDALADADDDWRQTNVRFLQLNETVAAAGYHHKISGNFGYEPGLPVIVSHLRPANASRNATDNADDEVLDYFHVNGSRTTRHHLRIPRFTVDGRCSLHDTETVDFNRDFRIKCSVPLRPTVAAWLSDGDGDELVLTGRTNFTELCTRMQQHVFGVLLADVQHAYGNQSANRTDGSSGPTLVSSLGNPENRTDRWSALRVAVAEWPPVSGAAVQMSNDDDAEDSDAVRSFRCAQMVLSVSYEFVTARLRQAGGRQQWTLREASVRLGARVNVRFDATADATDEWSVPVFVDGVFVDLTSAATGCRVSSWIPLAVLVAGLVYNN